MLNPPPERLFQLNPLNFDYDLPEELIAQDPVEKRDDARLMITTRSTQSVTHTRFYNLKDYLKAGDVLVLNKAKVSPVKVMAQRVNGLPVEVVFLHPSSNPDVWAALCRPLLSQGATVKLGEASYAQVTGHGEKGEHYLEIHGTNVDDLLKTSGQIPLPPYIKREGNKNKPSDDSDYQTVYAAVPGSVAAPTAGLHFTQTQLDELKKQGVQILDILLHVGWGTFKPIWRSLDLHQMLEESFEIEAHTLQELKRAKKEGRRIIGVGTTVTRTLESLPLDVPSANLKSKSGIFIKPGFKFHWLDGLITNFHVPRSTPLSLVAAFMGLPQLETVYEEAIREKYRFYSYGDAMLIL